MDVEAVVENILVRPRHSGIQEHPLVGFRGAGEGELGGTGESGGDDVVVGLGGVVVQRYLPRMGLSDEAEGDPGVGLVDGICNAGFVEVARGVGDDQRGEGDEGAGEGVEEGEGVIGGGDEGEPAEGGADDDFVAGFGEVGGGGAGGGEVEEGEGV